MEPKKHPLLEREFLIAIMCIGGGIGLIAMGEKELGTYLIMAAVAAFGVSRGLAKVGSGAKILLIGVTLLFVAGCCKGHVRADSIDGLVDKITRRHDNFIKGEATEADKDPRKKDSHLRSSEILRKIVDEAIK